MTYSRRMALTVIGATAIGGIGSTTARIAAANNAGGSGGDGPGELRLFSQQSVNNSMEVVTEEKHAYVATGGGMAVVDVHNPGRP